jgi:hypothetical protein
MSENNIITVNPALFASVAIDKDDLVSVQVARVETKLIQDQHETESVLRELKKKFSAAESNLNKAVDAVKDDFDISALTRAMESLGFTNEVNIGAAIKDDNVIVSISIENFYSRPVTHKVEFNDRIRRCLDEIGKIKEEIEGVQVKLINIRKRLSQIGMVERQAKARLAVATMQNSEVGRALLEQLDGVVGLPEIG